MRTTLFFTTLVIGFSGGNALAACTPESQIQNSSTADVLGTLVQGKTVCGVRGNDKWQEEHRAGGQLWDYKLGPSDPVDPTARVGSWAVTGTGPATQIGYTYTDGSTFNFTVHDNGGGFYDFCQGGASITTTLEQSGQACTGVPSVPAAPAGTPVTDTGTTGGTTDTVGKDKGKGKDDKDKDDKGKDDKGKDDKDKDSKKKQ